MKERVPKNNGHLRVGVWWVGVRVSRATMIPIFRLSNENLQLALVSSYHDTDISSQQRESAAGAGFELP